MRICALTKYPPIEGGVSARCYWIARALAMRGHKVHVVTNAGEVEDNYRMWMPPEECNLLEASFDNGGRVTVVSSGAQRRALAHIPSSNPFVSKLSALATEEIRRHRCDVVFSYYFEPYGISGHLASMWTGVPHVVQHAGSDRGRLLNHPELSLAYGEMLRRANVVVTSDLSLEGLGIAPARFVGATASFLPRQHFNESARPLDVDALLARAAAHPFVHNPAPWHDDLPTIGVLGKVGEVKGSYDLIAALARLGASSRKFNFLALVAGAEQERFLAAVVDAGLGDRTWILPLLPHWHVPAFLRRCTAVCFLERRFPIRAHRPGIPQEILACGVCAVISREIANKQSFRSGLQHGENVLVVEDPTDAEELAGVLDSVVCDPSGARAIGAAGASLVEAAGEDELGRTYEELLRRAVDDRRGVRRGTSAADVRAFLSRHAPVTARVMAQEINAALETRGAERTASAPLVAYQLMEQLDRECVGASPDPTREIRRLERDLVWLAVDLETPNGIPQFPRPPVALALAQAGCRRDELTPVRSNWLRISEYPASIVNGGGGLPVIYIFHKRGDLGRRVYRINGATRQLLELCDGSRNVDQIRTALAERGIETPDLVSEMIDRLARDGVLHLL